MVGNGRRSRDLPDAFDRDSLGIATLERIPDSGAGGHGRNFRHLGRAGSCGGVVAVPPGFFGAGAAGEKHCSSDLHNNPPVLLSAGWSWRAAILARVLSGWRVACPRL